MPTPSIAWLDTVRRSDVATVGGKAANLGELLAAGFPVPQGFVLTASACERFFASIGLADYLAGLDDLSPSEAAQRLATISSRIRMAELPPELEQEILGAHAQLCARQGGERACVVRSSATAEDLAEASFAGQHGTYYYVDRAQLLPMIRNCWASLWSEGAVSYRSTHGIAHASAAMAVIVQEMIPSQISGVVFTLNPVSGARDEIVIESSWGMGAGIVDGRVTPDRFVLERHGLRLREQRIAEKRVRVSTTLRKDAVGRVVAVPLEQQQAATLSLEEAREIARWALRAEERFGTPQDLEWASTDGRIHVLQSRPVTVAGRKEFCRNQRGGKYVLFKPLAENFTDPLTPLSASLWFQGPVPPGLALIGGRPYFDLDVIRRIVPLRLTDTELAQALYLSAEGLPRRLRLAPLRLPLALLVGLVIYLVMANVYARSARLPPDFMDIFRRRARSVDREARYGVREAFLKLFLGAKLSELLLGPLGHKVMALNVSAARYFVWLAVLKKLLRRYLPDLPKDAIGLLISGGEGVLSAETGRRIWALAMEAKRNAAVRRILLENPPDEALAALREEPEATGFVARLDDFLAEFGHRAFKEFEFRSPRWEEDPGPVLGMVRNYLLVEGDPADHDRAAAERRAALQRTIHERLASRPLEKALRIRTRLVRHAANRVKYFATLRENSRFYWVMAAGVVRKKILRLEEELIAKGRLKCKDDVFFLEWREVEELRDGRLEWKDVERRIGERRRDFVRLSKMTPPKTIGIAAATLGTEDASGALVKGRAAQLTDTGGTLLKGQSASPGRCEGTARVILDPSQDVELRPGEVLVAPYTDPAWTPLFLTAGAAVVEVGSFLSHAGTVAREFGLPCVVDVPECTSRIKTGDPLLVDGDAGVVRLLA
jgi:pyruvate,water dikinase